MEAFVSATNLLAISMVIGALALRHIRARDARGTGISRRASRFAGATFPLSIAIHLAALLFLIVTASEIRGTDFVMANFAAAGEGGGELNNPDVAKKPMPNVRPGLDVVLVIGGTISMNLVIDDVKARMGQLIRSIHRLAPAARVGIVVFGGKGEKMKTQPLTLSPLKLQDFVSHTTATRSFEWEDDTYGACEYAINRMDWKPHAKKVIVLVGDSPPREEDFQPLIQLIGKFKDENGTFNTVDVTAAEHEHREKPPEFYQRTRAAYKVLADAGGGSMKSLSKDIHIKQ